MIITKVFLKSYRTYNFDFQKKTETSPAKYKESLNYWDSALQDSNDFESWKPFVEVPIPDKICSIVGSNESGKSHLLKAVHSHMNKAQYRLSDVCRYYKDDSSKSFYTGLEISYNDELGEWLRERDEWEHWTAQEDQDSEGESDPEQISSEILAKLLEEASFKFYIFSRNFIDYVLVMRSDDQTIFHDLDSDESDSLFELLPEAYFVDSEVSLPSTVRYSELLWASFTTKVEDKHLDINSAQNWSSRFKSVTWGNPQQYDTFSSGWSEEKKKGLKLLYKLLLEAGELTDQYIDNLGSEVEAFRGTEATNISQKIQSALKLNKFWAQDVDLTLKFKFDTDKVEITTLDRTNAEYNIGERSRGFSNFLAYILQLALLLRSNSKPKIILADEPDFALSALGQRNLLSFFRSLSDEGHQIIYTTHSFELIDPNFPDRAVAIVKGQDDEGTICIHNKYRGFFEPLRTALGERFQRLPFVDGPNLLVEGFSDLKFVTRSSQYLARMGMEFLDLSSVSIVVLEGTPHLEKVITQAKNVMGERAYLTVLLDDDCAGRDAEKVAIEIDEKLKLDDQILLMSSTQETGTFAKDSEIEDLIPTELYRRCLLDELSSNLSKAEISVLENDEEFLNQAKNTPVLDCVDLMLDRAGLKQKVDQFSKPNVIERAFDYLEQNTPETEFKEFEERIISFNRVLRNKVSENALQILRHRIRKQLRQKIKMHKRFFPIDCSYRELAQLIDQIEDATTTVQIPDSFSKHLEKIRKQINSADNKLVSIPDAEYKNLIDRLESLPSMLIH